MATFEQQVDIKAPVETVWSILANPNEWPLWFPGITGVTNLSAVETGGTFQWQEGDATNAGSIVRVDPNQRLEVTTQSGGHQASHIFTLAHHGGLFGFGADGTRLDYKLAYHAIGGFIGEFIAGGNPVDTLKVKHTLGKIKELAEGEAGHYTMCMITITNDVVYPYMRRVTIMGIIATLVLGLLAGWITGMLMKGNGGYGVVGDIVLGIIGAMVGGWLTGMVSGLNVTSLIVSVIGAVIVVAIFRLVTGRRVVR